MPKWNELFSDLIERVSAWELQRDIDDQLSRIANPPFKRQLTYKEHVYWSACVVVTSSHRTQIEFRESFQSNFVAGRFITASIISRSWIEVLGMLNFTNNRLLNAYERDPTNPIVTKRLNRLMRGTKGPVRMPWGLTAEEYPPIHVMDYVRQTEFVEEYDWLCNAAHPTMMQHFYLFMAGRHSVGEATDSFNDHLHVELGRLVELCERLFDEVYSTIVEILNRSLPETSDIR